MSAVKGSKQTRLMVISYDPWDRFWKRLFVLLFLIGLSAAFFFWGRFEGHREQEQAISERNKLRIEVAEKNQQIESLAHRVAVLEKGGEVDRQATENMRETIASLRQQLEKIQEENSLYKGVMAPSESEQVLGVSKVDVFATSVETRFRFKVMLVQTNSRNRNYVRGFAFFNVIGVENGETKTYPLHALSDDVPEQGVRYSYKYYQEVEGEVNLPVGFTPEQIQVIMKTSSGNRTRLDESFNWAVKEG